MFLAINKDSDPSQSGVIHVEMDLHDELECIYLTGPSLNATTNITFAGYYFNTGSSSKQGSFESYKFSKSNVTNKYEVTLNHSQAVLCYHQDSEDALTVESRLNGLSSWENSLLLKTLLLFVLLLLLTA